jgi:outer membrane receptor protein involved in Fe transport
MRMLMQRTRIGAAALGAVLALGGVAAAQGEADDEPIDIEVPAIVSEGATGDGDGPIEDASDIDLANVVQSAAKSITTVQEAPAIVTVITADDIKERQFQFLDQAIDTVPGWYRVGLYYSNFQQTLVRGQIQAVQFLHDSTSLFDPGVNIASMMRAQPMETIKRIELITGPGGVLWGSNSLLGIINIITKDADDVDGVEVGGTLGDGNGDRKMARAYAMVGAPDLLDGKLKLFAHASFETTDGHGADMPLLLFHQPLPQPNAPTIYGPLTTTTQPRSYFANFDAKLSMGKFTLRVQFPWTARYTPLGFSAVPAQEHLPDDDNPACPTEPPFGGAADPCLDSGRKGRKIRMDFYDRYVVGEYRTRFADQKAGLSIKAYAMQFVRELAQLQVLAPSVAIKGGLAFSGSGTTYRAGGAIDGDFDLGRKLRVLYGAEGFSEILPANTTRSLQGAGAEATFPGPYDLSVLPLLCPRQLNSDGTIGFVPECPLTFAFEATRTVLGGYVNPQWRPSKKLILDFGARLQVAPGALGKLSYKATPTFAGSLVYEFIPDYHVKLNFTQGFRPPVFNNTNSNGSAVQVTGDPDLVVETSDAAQVEINARIFKGVRRIRELSFRADYSYTRLSNLIQVAAGQYRNTADRGLHSAELLAKLFVQGGHRVELGYTWLRVDSEDKGRIRTSPEHWFNLATVFSLVGKKLTMTTNFRITGAFEDANRLVEYRDLEYDEMGNLPPGQQISVSASEVVMDRLPPIADVEVGVTWMPMAKLLVRATVFNALNGRFYHPDAFGDYEPHLEYLPNPSEDLRAYVSATYQY